MENQYYQQLLEQVEKAENVFIANTATVIGNVKLGAHASVWYGAVIRGDEDEITVGENTNIQDNAVVHVDHGVPVHIGNNCVVGHSAIIHGCTISDDCLIGMRATIMNNAKIGKGCIIGAHALVTEDTEIPDYSLVIGMPAKVKKQLDPDTVAKMLKGVGVYKEEAMKYLSS
jgi:carbonic anhydrase/acetyltransferase-like protein (isoleucine patch superfamily)